MSLSELRGIVALLSKSTSLSRRVAFLCGVFFPPYARRGQFCGASQLVSSEW